MKKSQLVPLERLDLKKCQTVGDIVTGMSKCAFGARMLGEVCLKIFDWIQRKNAIMVVYDGKALLPIFEFMKSKGWINGCISSTEAEKFAYFKMIVVGRFSEALDHNLENIFRPDAIYINKEEFCRPGQIKDGYFPDAVFANPKFVIPVLVCVLLEWLEGKKVNTNQLFSNLPFEVRNLEGAAETLLKMVRDPECRVFMTLSGAMTIAKMGLVICDMIDMGMVQLISSTGALMAHGLIEGVGLKHYKYNPAHDDKFLRSQRLNRVTDTLEPEENFSHIEEIVDKVLWSFKPGEQIGPSIFHWKIGEYLSENYPSEPAILKSAFQKNVPILCPAFVDSELGNDVFAHNKRRKQNGDHPLVINPELDSEVLIDHFLNAPRAGLFSIGGGVPRNNTQNVAPLIEITNERLGYNWPEKKYMYGVRIAPDAMHYGHLSGCTYSENASWGKTDIEHGQFAEIRGDATQIWPFLVKYVMEKL